MEAREPNGPIPAFPAPMMKLEPDDFVGFVDTLLNGADGKPGCCNDLAKLHQKEYYRLLCTDLIHWFRQSGEHWDAIPEILGTDYDHTIRQLNKAKLTGEQIFCLLRAMRPYPDCLDTVTRFLGKRIPPFEALIAVEDHFRTAWLSAPASAFARATLLDAVLMSAFCQGEHMNEMRNWSINFSPDLRDALGHPPFRALLRSILDDALDIASEDAQLSSILSAWPCPLTDGEPFLHVFAPVWNDRHYTWFIAYEANSDQF